MIRINAFGVITPMANEQPGGDGAFGYLITKSMGVNLAAFLFG
jgi:hypothetical protein